MSPPRGHLPGERIAIPGSEPRVVRATAAPLAIDRWAQAVPVERAVRERWEAFLRAPRWIWIAGGPPGIDSVLITFHSERLDPLAARLGDVTDLYETVDDHVTVLGVRASDRALVGPLPTERRWWGALFEALQSGAKHSLLAQLAEPEWRPLRSQTGFELDHHLSGFGMAQARFSAFAGELVTAGRRALVLLEAEAAAIVAEARRRERRLFRAARAVLASSLDGSAIAHLRRAGAPVSPATYNFLTAGGSRRRWREQAIGEYPALVAQVVSFDLGPLFEAEEAEWNAARDEARRAHGLPIPADLVTGVDAGERLAVLLARHFQVREGTVRRLRRVTRSRLRGNQLWGLETLVRILDRTPYEHWPRTRLEGVAAAVLAPGLDALEVAFKETDPVAAHAFREGSLREFLVQCGRRGWIASAQRLERTCTSRSFTSSGEAFGSLRVALHASGIDVAAPASALAKLPVERLLRWNEAWRSAMATYEYSRLGAAPTSRTGTIAWPALVEGFVTDTRKVVPLTDTDAVREEGIALQHCVTSHAMWCIAGRRHLFSVRTLEGVPLSTVQVDLQIHPVLGVRPKLIQHRALRNARPDAECDVAVGELFARVNALPSERFAAIEEVLKERLVKFRTMEAQRAAEGLRHHWYALRQSLPREVLAVVDAASP